MKGLILKDLYCLSGYKKTLLIVIAGYTAWFMLLGMNSMFNILVIMAAIMVQSLFSYDEFNKWDNYALSLPVTRREIVAARYLVAVGMVLFAAAAASILTLIYQLIRPGNEMMAAWIAMEVTLAGSIWLLAVLLPIIYRFGVEKCRAIIVALFLIPTGLFIVVARSGSVKISEISEGQLIAGVHILLAAGIAALFPSFWISRRLFEKKDL